MQAEGEEGSWGDFASGYLKQGFNSGLSFASAFSPVLSGLSGHLSLGFSPQEASGAATFELGAFAASAFAGGSGSASLLKFRLPVTNRGSGSLRGVFSSKPNGAIPEQKC